MELFNFWPGEEIVHFQRGLGCSFLVVTLTTQRGNP